MIRRIKAHQVTWPIFLVFCLAIMGLIFGFQNDSSLVINTSIMAIFLYMIFAFTHHHLDKTFKLDVILEYILLAALVLILVVGTAFY
jgi:low affinity Fe/Cu permease